MPAWASAPPSWPSCWTGASCRFVDVNETACRVLRYSRQELLSLSVTDIEAVLPDDFSWQTHVRELKEKGGLLIQGNYRRRGGRRIPVEVQT